MADAGVPTNPPSGGPAAEFHLTAAELDPIDQFRRDHKTAVLVVMFTDLKGSTDLAEQKGEIHSQAVRRRHDELLRAIVERGGTGRVVKAIGDSLMCVFIEPTGAVERAVEIQQRVADDNARRPGESPIEVRIGIHMGQVVVEEAVRPDVFGRHVNRAARVESLADGGQILVTMPVYDSACGWLASRRLVWKRHGDYLLKGIDEPVAVYEVCAPGTVPRPPAGKRVRGRRIGIALLAAVSCAVAALGLSLAFRGVTDTPVADRTAAVTQDATRRAEAKSKDLLRIAHPTAKYLGVRFKESAPRADGGHAVTFEIQYEGTVPGLDRGKACVLELVMDYSTDGKYEAFEWGRDTGKVPPGLATSAAKRLLGEP